MKKAIFARIEFYNFLFHYFAIINKLLGFCSQHLTYAVDFTNEALFSIPVSDGLDNLKSQREQISKMQKQISKMQKQIKAYKTEIDDLSNEIKRSISYCKEKENESIITIKPINSRD